MFLLKVGALEIVRRFSGATCPFVWSGIQALQVVCYPPLKWIERWAPFKGLVSGMQVLSRPLLVLSIATALSDQRDHNNVTSDTVYEPQGPNDSEEMSVSTIELPSDRSIQDTSVPDEAPLIPSSENWLFQLYAELEKQGIILPERINEDELRRFYIAANRNFRSLLSAVKKTIRWKETYYILSGQELEMWSHLVFWHGFDVENRPCLFVRLGLACNKLSPHERPRFVQAVVSQVEHGILHFIDPENPHISVLVDCDGLSPLRIPMQMLRTCTTILQEHFPGRLGTLFVIRLPPVVRVISQTFIQVLRPSTRQKLKFYGEMYLQLLRENFQILPSYLGSNCTCRRCLKPSNFITPQPVINRSLERGRRSNSLGFDDVAMPYTSDEIDTYIQGSCDHVIRTAVIGVLVFWIIIALIAGIYDPESRPTLPLLG